MIRLTAYAKINLFLEITGKRPDGYHTLTFRPKHTGLQAFAFTFGAATK